MVNQLSKINFRNNYFISCDIFISKQLIQLRRKIFKGFFLLPIRRFRIYVHRSLDVLVSHDGLDHFEIALHLAEPGRKGMPEMMAGKFRKQQWLAAFPCSTETLIGVIAVHNPLNRAVDTGRIRQGTEAVLKNEIKHAARVLSRYRDARRTRILRIRLRLTVRVNKEGRYSDKSTCPLL